MSASYREKVPIRGYVGANGAGKTLLAVCDAVAAGYPIFSTVEIQHDLFRPITSFDDLLQAENGTVLLDEVQSIASSRTSGTMPPEVLNFLMQLRKQNLQCIWTTPAWSRADVALREVTKTVTRIQGFFAKDNGTLWPSPRLIRARTYDAVSLQNVTQDKMENFDAARRLESKWYVAKKLYEKAPYVSGERIIQISAPSTGACPHCGGRRSVPACQCGKGERPARGAAGAPRSGVADPGLPRPAAPAHSVA